MSKLVWDKTGERLYETGVKQGVLYPQAFNGLYPRGYAWNGLTSVSESPSGAEPTPLYADDIKYLNLISAEEFGGTIGCYTYPPEFGACNGEAELTTGVSIGQQERKAFGFCYRSAIGNDVDGSEHGYKLHLVYGALASPSEVEHSTINDSPEAVELSYEFSTTPVSVNNFKPTAHLVIDSTKANPAKLAALEDVLYGTSNTDARLPLPDEVAALMSTSATTYAVTNYLTNVATSNEASIATGTYTSTLTAAEGYVVTNVIVMMGGVDITATAYTSGTGAVSVASVTGPIIIFATANEE